MLSLLGELTLQCIGIQLEAEIKRGQDNFAPTDGFWSHQFQVLLAELRRLMEEQGQHRTGKWFWKDRWHLLKELRNVLDTLIGHPKDIQLQQKLVSRGL